MRSKQFISVESLPETRLELRWTKGDFEKNGIKYNWSCDYHLVLALWSLDIRGEIYENDEFIGREQAKRLTLGGTYSRQSHSPVKDDFIDTPFRDGSHIAWDAARLGLPAFVVCGDVAMCIPPAARPPLTK